MLTKLGYQMQSDFLFTYPFNTFNVVQTVDTDGNIIENGTLRDLLQLCQSLYNADIKVVGNVVSINRNRTFGTPSFVIENYVLISKELDLSECPSSILLRFNYDSADKNTVTNGIGNCAQALFDRHGDAKVNEIQLARAKRKDELTIFEKILATLIDIFDGIVNTMINVINGAVAAINAVIGLFNRIVNALNTIGIRLNIRLNPIPQLRRINLSASITDRIGNMLVEADTWGVGKLAMVTNGEIDVENRNFVNAGYIYNQFWQQRFVYEKWKIQIATCYGEFVQLANERYVILEGQTFKVIEAQFNVNSTIADLTLSKIKANDRPESQLIIT
jgi:hypothetical protein